MLMSGQDTPLNRMMHLGHSGISYGLEKISFGKMYPREEFYYTPIVKNQNQFSFLCPIFMDDLEVLANHISSFVITEEIEISGSLK